MTTTVLLGSRHRSWPASLARPRQTRAADRPRQGPRARRRRGGAAPAVHHLPAAAAAGPALITRPDEPWRAIIPRLASYKSHER